jgi:NADH-quinone oxidoreductase subunit J
MATFVFWVLAIVSVAASLGLVLMRRAVHCALMLAAVMLSLAVLYALQDAPFLAFVQVIVYTGAVLMLFLFVVMLVGVSASESVVEVIRGQRFWAAIAGIGFLVLLCVGLGNATMGDASGLTSANAQYGGNVQGLAYLVFNRYVYAFEVTSALLITAALGAMVLAHRERLTRKATQKELSRERIRGDHPTPLPSPGVYARHNAVDVPALLPDGSIEPLSVSETITRRQELEGHRVEPPAGDVQEVSEIVEHGEYESAEAANGTGGDDR